MGSKGSGTTTFTFQLTDPSTFSFDRSGDLPSVHVEGNYTYDASSRTISFTNTSVATNDSTFEACLNVVGTYNVTFSGCSYFTVTTANEPCNSRFFLSFAVFNKR